MIYAFLPLGIGVSYNQLMDSGFAETAVTALENAPKVRWPDLQMAALALQGQLSLDGRSDAGCFGALPPLIAIFLITWPRCWPSDQRAQERFVSETAVLDRFCALFVRTPFWAPARTAGSSSQQILDQLESASLFLIPLDDERRWYRYHHRLLPTCCNASATGKTRAGKFDSSTCQSLV